MAVIELNSELFHQYVNEGEKPVLVDFWAPWCVYCRRIAPAYDKIGEQYSDKLVIAKMNIDENAEIANKEHIEVIPTLVLYHKGQALGSIVAPESKAAIEEFIQEHMG